MGLVGGGDGLLVVMLLLLVVICSGSVSGRQAWNGRGGWVDGMG